MAPAARSPRLALPLRGVADVRPEIARVVAVEDRTASAYQAAVDRFKSGRNTAEALAQLIDRTIMPELQAEGVRLKALDKVPPEHQPLVADAKEYVRLRSESWRLRSEGLRKTSVPARREAGKKDRPSNESPRARAEAQHRASMMTMGKAEGTERASLEALQRIKPANTGASGRADRGADACTPFGVNARYGRCPVPSVNVQSIDREPRPTLPRDRSATGR
jgi:hypothetical protein